MSMQRKLKAKVIDIINYSENVRLFRFKPEKRIPRFKSGQFLHLAIDPYDPSFNWPESRVFSIMNSPSRSEYIEILVSKVGKFTSRMFNEIKLNDNVWIKLAYGTFNFDDSINQNTVLIAGGTGISPFVSFLQYAIDNNLNPAIHLNYGVRNTDLIIVEDLIKEAEQKLPNFNYRIHVERIKGDGSKSNLLLGFLPVKDIVQNSLKVENPIFYLSGPPAMITSFDKELKDQGIESQNIKYDNWE